MRLAFNIFLTILILGLAYWLYASIQEPIDFNREYSARRTVVIERLKEVRTAQMAYRDGKGEFAGDFNKLIRSLKNDSVAQVRVIGNPDDTTAVVVRDTTFVPMWSLGFNQNYSFDSLRYIPFGNGKEFSIDAGQVQRNKVTIPVFEVSAPENVWASDLNQRYVDPNKALTVGSMSDGTYSGNWGE